MPVFSGDRVVGAVSVGVLQTRVSDLALLYLPWIVVSAGVALLLGVGLAVLVARRLRRQTLGLEPEEITAAYTHHDAVLHAVGEGLLVVDGDGRLVVVNAEARRLLGIDGPQRPGLAELDSDPAVRAVLERGLATDLRDEPALAGERVLLVNSRSAGPPRARARGCSPCATARSWPVPCASATTRGTRSPRSPRRRTSSATGSRPCSP